MALDIELSTIIAIFILIIVLVAIICSLIDIFVYKIDQYDSDDIDLQKWIDEYKKNNPKKKG